MVNSDLALLHPTMRQGVLSMNSMLAAAKIPLKLYEGWREPARQAELYVKTRVPGKGKMGPPHVTFSKPWVGRHQYGLAADYVFWVNGKWTWVEPEKGMWDEFDRLDTSCGLESVKFERPHVQLANIKLSDLVAGRYPDGGDASWSDNLTASIKAWGSKPYHVDIGGVGFDWPSAPPAPVVSDTHTEEPGRVWEVPAGYYYDEERGMCLIASPLES